MTVPDDGEFILRIREMDAEIDWTHFDVLVENMKNTVRCASCGCEPMIDDNEEVFCPVCE